MAQNRLLMLSRLALCQMTWQQKWQIKNMRSFIVITALASLMAGSAISEDMCAAGYLQQRATEDGVQYWAREFPEVVFFEGRPCDDGGVCSYDIIAFDGDNRRVLGEDVAITDICNSLEMSVETGATSKSLSLPVGVPDFRDYVILSLSFKTLTSKIILSTKTFHENGQDLSWGIWEGDMGGGSSLTLNFQTKDIYLGWLHEERSGGDIK